MHHVPRMRPSDSGITQCTHVSLYVSEGSSVQIKAHQAPVRSVQFSCDGQLLVSASDDKSVKIWSVNDRKFQYAFTHTNWVRSAVFS